MLAVLQAPAVQAEMPKQSSMSSVVPEIREKQMFEKENFDLKNSLQRHVLGVIGKTRRCVLSVEARRAVCCVGSATLRPSLVGEVDRLGAARAEADLGCK